jgi:YidC/Oxa1 family membrane protein insertase
MWDALIVNPFVNVLLFIYSLVGNLGVAIILFTILIRVLTHPLTVQQLKGTSAMQDLQKDPRWIEANAKYKNDKEKLSQVQMQLYKEMGVNPFASCLPTLIQFPILIGLYQALIATNANLPLDLLNLSRRIYPSFLDLSSLLPLNSQFLWMNLGQPERLNIPGIPFGIPILAIVVVVTTYFQSRLMTPPTQGDQQSNMMMGMMNIYMPFLMGWLALTLASGLSIYFVASNLVTIGQYALLGKLNWDNLIPGRGKQAAAAGTRKTSIPGGPRPVVESGASASNKISLPTRVDGGSAKTTKATKTVKATKPSNHKPTKMNPKPK